MSDLTIIPDGWQKRSLISLADYVNGYSFGPSDWAEDGRLIIKIEQLNNPNAKGARFSGDISPAYHIVNGDLIFSWSATLKAEFWKGEPGVLNQHLFKVIPNSDVNISLLQKLLEFYMDELAAGSQGSTMKHITRAELIKFHVVLPIDKDEQQKIAKILSTVDNLIEKTQTLIDKYTAIKQGMMADLFTRGIDMTTGDTPNSKGGKLRPSVEDAPELYKQTELGWVPKEWEVLSFGELADYKNGNSFSAEDWKEEGYPIIRIQNLNGSNEYNYYEGPVKEGWHILLGDLLFAWSGQKGISFGARIWNGPEGVLNQHIFKVYENSKLLTRQFLYYLFKLNVGRIEGNAHGFKDSFVHVTRSELTDVTVMVPPKEEQAVIEQRVMALDRKLEQELESLEKYKKLKKGLMQDLLTGTVRV